MDEADVQRKARGLVAAVDVSGVRTDLSIYLTPIRARVREEKLGSGESGFTVTKRDGSHVITINCLESEERRRFTVCHEIAHIVLGLPSNHQETPSWALAKRDPNEVMCDTFAAELLMPHKLWRASALDREPSEQVIADLAAEFRVSFPAAASRYAGLAEIPSAFVTMQGGIVRYAARSTPLRRVGAAIRSRSPIPSGSIAHRLRAGQVPATEVGVVAQDTWFEDWDDGYDLNEMARHHHEFDTTLSLLWFFAEEMPERDVDRFGRPVVEDELLPELTGELPWPGKRRRR
jgi:Zn-dependent peptidase ImmA (M78 family)